MSNQSPENQNESDQEFTGGLVSISPGTLVGAFILMLSPLIVAAGTLALVHLLTGR
jgi:hypothetical protein